MHKRSKKSSRPDKNKLLSGKKPDKDSSEIFTKIFYNSPAMMVISDASTGIVIDMNRQFEKFYGHKRKEIIGKTLKQIKAYVNPSDREVIAAFVMKERHGKNFEVQEMTKTGEVKWVNVSVQLIHLFGKKCFLGSGIDITEKKNAEEALKKLNSELEQKVAERTRELEIANKKLQGQVHDLDTFVYKASHDLKGPLSSVSGLVNLAEMSLKEDKEASEYISRIKESNTKLDNILNNLLAVTRLTHGTAVKNRISVSDLLCEVIGSLSNFPGRESVQVKNDIRMKKDFTGDVTALSSILQNLIQNAIAYRRTNVESFVSVTAFQDGKNMKIEVADNGIGIPAEFHKKVFHMFYRADEESKGSGLGLFIVKTAVEKMNGTIELKSVAGQGTVITVSIPQ